MGSKYHLKRMESYVHLCVSTYLIRGDIKDPRVSDSSTLITISAVEASSDLRLFRVYVSIHGTEGAKRKAFKALGAAQGYVRWRIAPRLRLRRVPEILFVYDSSIERGCELVKRIDHAVAKDDHDAPLETENNKQHPTQGLPEPVDTSHNDDPKDRSTTTNTPPS